MVQLVAVISQDNKPIAFYSRILNLAQVNHRTTESNLLSIVETLKELRNILLGQQKKGRYLPEEPNVQIFQYKESYEVGTSSEELSPELIYIKGSESIVADALSRLGKCPMLR